MRWFEGGIAEAVTTSKAKNAVFVVFVEGKDDASKKVATSVDSVEVSAKLESDDFVAIRLDSESEAYRQFAQIYQLVPVPSLFFIGGNGVPLEVVAGEVDETELVRRVNTVLEKSGKSTKEENASSETVKSQETSSVAENASSSQPETAAASVASASNEPTSSSDALTAEEKVERAKELIEKKRKLKQEEEEQALRSKELDRRKMGQDVQKLRRWQQEQELKQLKEERQREKAEEAAARERILKQIAQDRADRAARFGTDRDSSQKTTAEPGAKKQTEQETHERSTANIARIQFRLPDGTAHTHTFESSTTLEEVRTYATMQLNMPFREFSLSTSFPRREFSATDNSQTLRDLQLVPTAVILILPASASSGVTSSSPSYSMALSRMVWSLLTPLFSLLNYLRGLVFGGGNSDTGGSSGNSRTDSSRTQSSTGAKRRKTTSETAIHRQGNIHRLTNHRDSSDDENNTWNGNSTQQM